MLKPCLTCGALSRASRCLAHRGTTSWNGARDRETQSRFRAAVLAAAGHQCQHYEHGQRCTETTSLQAHHAEPTNNDPATGLALCQAHHRLHDPHAR